MEAAVDVELEPEPPEKAAPEPEDAAPMGLSEYQAWAMDKAGVDGRFQCRLYFLLE